MCPGFCWDRRARGRLYRNAADCRDDYYCSWRGDLLRVVVNFDLRQRVFPRDASLRGLV
jgi:hypothetical protein